jgi:predicted GNAT superfamily acetyltransferase
MAEPASERRIDIRPLDTIAQIHEAAEVLREVWVGDRDALPPNLIRALAHSGNYVVGLYEDDRMVGASIAFFGPPAARTMHSHIT